MPSKRNRQTSQQSQAPEFGSGSMNPALSGVQKLMSLIRNDFDNRKQFLDQTFVAISMNYLVGTKGCDYVPIEIGLQCYNFIQPAPFDDFHKFIKPAPDAIPSGFLFDAMEKEKFHKIPQKGLPEATTEYDSILHQIELLVKNDSKSRKYILYCARSEITFVKSALNYLNYGTFPVNVVAVEDLFIVIMWLVKSEMESINEPSSDFTVSQHTEVVRRLEGHRLHLFSNNCFFHQNLDCPNCSIGIVRRFWLHLDEYLSELKPKIKRILGLPSNTARASNFNAPSQEQPAIWKKEEMKQSATISQVQQQSTFWQNEEIKQSPSVPQFYQESNLWQNEEMKQNTIISQIQNQPNSWQKEEMKQTPVVSQVYQHSNPWKNEEIKQNSTVSQSQQQSYSWQKEEMKQIPTFSIREPLSRGTNLKSCLKPVQNQPQNLAKSENQSIDGNLSKFLISPQQKEPIAAPRDGFGPIEPSLIQAFRRSNDLSRREMRLLGLKCDDAMNTTLEDDEEVTRINSQSARQSTRLHSAASLGLNELESLASGGTFAASSPLPGAAYSFNFNFMRNSAAESAGQQKFVPLTNMPRQQQFTPRANEQARPQQAVPENAQSMDAPEFLDVRLPEKWLQKEIATNPTARLAYYNSVPQSVEYSVYRSRPHSFARNVQN